VSTCADRGSQGQVTGYTQHLVHITDRYIFGLAANLSQNDFVDMGSANQAIALGNKHWTNMPMVSAVIHLVTGKEIQYMDLMKDPTLQLLRKREFGNKLGCLFQGIRDI
jgi:hypothetical protein